jgi:hypothetical protein
MVCETTELAVKTYLSLPLKLFNMMHIYVSIDKICIHITLIFTQEGVIYHNCMACRRSYIYIYI